MIKGIKSIGGLPYVKSDVINGRSTGVTPSNSTELQLRICWDPFCQGKLQVLFVESSGQWINLLQNSYV